MHENKRATTVSAKQMTRHISIAITQKKPIKGLRTGYGQK